MPIFIIGFIVLLVFVALIIVSQTSDKKDSATNIPTLIKIKEEPKADEELTTTQSDEDDKTQPPPKEITGELTTEQKTKKEVTLEQATLSKEGVAANYGTVEIRFTQNGFEPKNTTVYKWQIVRFVNETDKPITIKQTSPKYDEFENGVLIGAGNTFELEISKERLWTFMEVDSKKYGSIFANVAKNIF